jgi:prepilin peptidase CpaA
MFDHLLPAGPLRQAFPLFPWCLLGIGLLAAAISDALRRQVPNWLNVSVLACGLAARVLTAGWAAGLWGLAGAAAALSVLLYPFHRSWLGGGDVKLLVAAGAWLGPLLVAYAALLGAVVGGLLSIAWLIRSPRKLRREIADNLKLTAFARAVPEVGQRPTSLQPPMAVAIALGCTLAVSLFHRLVVLL